MSGQHIRTHRLKHVGRFGLAAAVGISMVSTAAVFRSELHDIATMIRPRTLLLAALLTVSYRILNAVNWGLVLRGISANLAYRHAARIWLTSEACRWLPGSLWSYGSRGVQAATAGVPRSLAAFSLPLELLLTITAWFATAAIFLFPHSEILATVLPATTQPQTSLMGLLLLIALPFIGWSISRSVRSLRPRLVQRWQHLRSTTVDKKKVTLAGMNYFALCGLNGLALYVVVQSLQPAQSVPVSAVIGVNAAAWLIGFFAFMAPGGLLVREGALATMLACWLPLELAVAVSVLWRVLQLSVELLCLGAILLFPVAATIRLKLAACRRSISQAKPDLKTSAEQL